MGIEAIRRAWHLCLTATFGFLLLCTLASSATAATLSGTVSGQVQEQPAGPLEEVVVTLLDPSTGDPKGSTKTDSAGEYSLDGPSGVFNVQFNPAPGSPFDSATVHGVELSADRTLNVILTAGDLVHLSGVLRSASGKPVPHATLYLNSEKAFAQAQTALDGSYFFAIAPGRYELVGYSGESKVPGLPSSWFLETAKFDLESDLSRDITLPPTSTLTVEVLGNGDEPIAGADVKVPELSGSADLSGFKAPYVQSRDLRADTDASGRVSFTVFRGGSTQNGPSTVDPPANSGYGYTTFEVPSVGQDTMVVVRPGGVVHLSGVLRSASGKPVPHATLYLNSEKAFAQAQTALDGSYFFAIAPGRYELVGYSGESKVPGLPSSWFLETAKFDLESDLSRDITLPPTSTLTVEVLGNGDEPIAGADVKVPELSGSADLSGFKAPYVQSRDLRADTDASGRVSFTVFRGGSTQNGPSTVDPPANSGYGYTTFEVPSVGQDTMVVVRPGGVVHLSGVLRSASGKPVPHATLYLNSEKAFAQAQTALDGSYFFAIAPGRYELVGYSGESKVPGLPSSWFLETAKFDLESDLSRDITLPPTSTLTVEVLGNGDEPIAGADVKVPELSGSADLSGFKAPYVQSRDLRADTDASGRVSFTVFRGGSTQNGPSTVDPPANSGYGYTTFEVPSVGQDTMVVVRFQATQGSKDTKPPQLSSLAIKPTSVNTSSSSRTVTLTAHITDDLSGFGSNGKLFFSSPSGKQSTVSTSFKRISGTATDGTYEIPVTFQQFSEAGTWSISTIRLSDQAGNEAELDHGYLLETGQPSTVQVESVQDTQPPQLLGLSLEPSTVDASSPDPTVRVLAHVTDDISGASCGIFTFLSPSGELGNYASACELISGSRSDGFLEGKLNFEDDSEAGIWRIVAVRFFDFAENERVLKGSQLEEAGLPTTVTVKNPLSPSIAGVTPASGPESGGTEVEISGAEFTEASEVRFGSAPATNVSVDSPTSITATAPPGSGTVDVTVTTHRGASAKSPADRFQYSPTISLTSGPNPSVYGSIVAFTAKVTPVFAKGAPVATGAITFIDGSTTLGTVSLSKGAAVLNASSLGTGSHSVIARYGGDSYFGPGESSPAVQVVTPATTQLTLTSSRNPAPFGSTSTLSATVKAVAPGTGTPTGTVTFSEGETTLATVPLVGKVAKYSMKTLAPGTHEITATYNGDGNYEPSESASLSQVIVKATTQLTLTSSRNPAPFGSTGTLSAKVKVLAPGTGTPTGTVTFSEGEAVLTTVPLSGKVAKFPIKGLGPGTHEITATYSGDGNYEPSESLVLNQTITP